MTGVGIWQLRFAQFRVDALNLKTAEEARAKNAKDLARWSRNQNCRAKDAKHAKNKKKNCPQIAQISADFLSGFRYPAMNPILSLFPWRPWREIQLLFLGLNGAICTNFAVPHTGTGWPHYFARESGKIMSAARDWGVTASDSIFPPRYTQATVVLRGACNLKETSQSFGQAGRMRILSPAG